MPYSKNGKRDYKREYEEYHSRPEQIKNRQKRNIARAYMESAGLAHKGDGMDVGHKNPLIKKGANIRNNLRMETISHNRSVSKTKRNRMRGRG